MIRGAARGAVGLLVLLIAGCAWLRPAPPTRSATEADTAFDVSGRFAVRFRDEAGSGRIAWSHAPAADELTIANPLGLGIARIVRRDGLYTLTTADNREHSTRDPDQLTEPVLGWGMPISGLPFWLRGRAVPGVPVTRSERDNERLTALVQSGWTIEYLSRHDGNGLPERMRLRRAELDIRLVLETWTAPP